MLVKITLLRESKFRFKKIYIGNLYEIIENYYNSYFKQIISFKPLVLFFKFQKTLNEFFQNLFSHYHY